MRCISESSIRIIKSVYEPHRERKTLPGIFSGRGRRLSVAVVQSGAMSVMCLDSDELPSSQSLGHRSGSQLQPCIDHRALNHVYRISKFSKKVYFELS